MGMFDDVRCEAPLPDCFTGVNFQTKDFACEMDKYTITKGGRLVRRYVADYEPTPESEWEYVGATDPLHQIWHMHSKRKALYAERDTDFHGWLNFYTSEGRGNTELPYKWYEYRAKFTDGNLVEIQRVETDET